MTPKRIQRQRTKGWRMPAGAVCCTRPGVLGNPFTMADAIEAGFVSRPDEPLASLFLVDCFREWFTAPPEPYRCDRDWWQGPTADARRAAIIQRLPDLRGRDLACWCRLCDRHLDGKPLGVECSDCQPCHADVLLELANAPELVAPVAEDRP